MTSLLPRDETVLLAVSGGIDSMCMAELFREAGMSFVIAHCNFHLRGDESDSDMSLVRKWADSNSVYCHIAHFDTDKYAVEHGISVEMAARELRYDWFASICKEHGYYATVVAHNANDNAETLILNLLRGTGLRGLTGMQQISEVPVSNDALKGVRLLRPLLDFTRDEIAYFAEISHLEYHNDHTNDEVIYKRNRIRHQVFPVFQTLNPSFLQTFTREMRIFGQVHAIAEDYFNVSSEGVFTIQEGGDELMNINVRILKGRKHWEYILYRLLSRFGFGPGVISQVTRLLEDDVNTFSGKVFLDKDFRIVTKPAGLSVLRNNGSESLPVLPGRIGKRPVMDNSCCVVVEGESVYRLCGNNIKITHQILRDVEPVTYAKSVAAGHMIAADSAILSFPFLLRNWNSGDWILPIGMKGKKKLSDLFTDLKLGIEDKKKAVVVVLPGLNNEVGGGTHVAAVFGHTSSGQFYCRMDEAVKCSSSTVSVILLAFT